MSSKNIEQTNLYKSLTSHGMLYPLVCKTADRCELIDIEGNTYLDFCSGYGVANVGWQRREVLEVLRHQAGISCFSPPWMANQEAIELARELIMLTPKRLTKCIRASGGGDANEVGIKAAYSYAPGEILSFYHSYHGGTSLTAALSDFEQFRFPKTPSQVHTNKVPPPYCYRCYFNQTYGQCSFECIEAVEKAVKNSNITALILEPIIGAGGIIVPPKEYFGLLNTICKRYQVRLIVDEVKTGFGRTGSMFAIDELEIDPDVLTLSKGLGGGYIPIGAAILTSDLANHLETNYNDVTSTYSWTPLASAVAVAIINLIQKEHLVSNSKSIGTYLRVGLQQVFEGYLAGKVGEVRGKALMIGVELVEDHRTKKPATILGRKILLECRNQGLIIGAAWVWNILVFVPPLILTESEADRGLNILESVLKKITKAK